MTMTSSYIERNDCQSTPNKPFLSIVCVNLKFHPETQRERGREMAPWIGSKFIGNQEEFSSDAKQFIRSPVTWCLSNFQFHCCNLGDLHFFCIYRPGPLIPFKLAGSVEYSNRMIVRMSSVINTPLIWLFIIFVDIGGRRAAVPLKRHIATAALEAVEEEKIDKVN